MIEQHDLNVGMYSLVSFAPRSLAYRDSPRKFCLLCLSLINTIPANAKILSGSLGKRGALTKATEKSCIIQFAILELRAVGTS